MPREYPIILEDSSDLSELRSILQGASRRAGFDKSKLQALVSEHMCAAFKGSAVDAYQALVDALAAQLDVPDRPQTSAYQNWLDELIGQIDDQHENAEDDEREDDRARAESHADWLDDQAAAADDEAIRAGTYPMDRG